ncbi:Sorting nexin MVP1 [Ceratobasidium theobromae]|uniref:Sorting nexin MVP1 n=1 Tax=Ceratobasidium theobromae TaxID=1582974 RepID=A0A5N5QC40_9AGAM|nr:Sorting nexin MVP1 [Ceratobasidium theobromae]
MFNASRGQLYAGNNNGFTMQGSFVEGPLGVSTFDGLDPWSATPSPPQSHDGLPPPLNSLLADAPIPDVYSTAYATVDPMASGDTSVNALHRVLATTGLPAATIERIVNLVSTRPRVSRLEFFVALALAGLAQASKDATIEQVSQAAQQGALPEPTIDLTRLSTTTSIIGYTPTPPPQLPSFDERPVPQRAPTFRDDDPWRTSSIVRRPTVDPFAPAFTATPENPPPVTGAGTSLLSSGLPSNWWKRQESAQVTTIPEKQGFLLNRYTVYSVQTDLQRGPAVQRRYSEFAWLWDCLIRRYPFRVVPSLPPKRIGPDDQFLEQRRRGLARFLVFVLNHPVLSQDGLLSVFLTEPHLETWRKQNSISLEEESLSKRVERNEEMSVPSDCEEKLAAVRKKLPGLVDHWTRVSVIVERLIKRREGAAADLARLTMTLNSLTEHNPSCSLRGESDDCELCAGVRTGLGRVAARTGGLGEEADNRVAMQSQRDLYVAFQALFVRHDRLGGDIVDKLKKRMETARTKHSAIVSSLEGLQGPVRDRAQDEGEKLWVSIEKDQHQIHALLNRRVFIQYCMWHELRVVLHNRKNSLLTLAVQSFVREENEYSGRVHAAWTALADEVESMPFE